MREATVAKLAGVPLVVRVKVAVRVDTGVQYDHRARCAEGDFPLARCGETVYDFATADVALWVDEGMRLAQKSVGGSGVGEREPLGLEVLQAGGARLGGGMGDSVFIAATLDGCRYPVTEVNDGSGGLRGVHSEVAVSRTSFRVARDRVDGPSLGLMSGKSVGGEGGEEESGPHVAFFGWDTEMDGRAGNGSKGRDEYFQVVEVDSTKNDIIVGFDDWQGG